MSPASPNAPVVLHLLEPSGDGWRSLEALRILMKTSVDGASPGVGHAPLLLGGSAAEQAACSLGVNTVDRIIAPAGRTRLAAAGLRRFIERRGRPACVHAWSNGASELARRALPDVPLIETTTAPESPPAGMLRFGGAGVATVDAPLPIAPDRLDRATRQRRRAAWGVDDETLVIGLIGDPPRGANAYRLAFLEGLLAEMGREVAGVAHPDAWRMERGRRLIESIGGDWRLIGDDAPPWLMLPGCDVALWRPRRRSEGIRRNLRERARPDGACWALACGVPVVALRDGLLADAAQAAPRLMRFADADDPLLLARLILGAFESARPESDEGNERRASEIEQIRRRHLPQILTDRLGGLYQSVIAGRDGAGVGATERAPVPVPVAQS